MPDRTKCPHLNFQAKVDVFRLSDEEGGPITGYSSHTEIHCADCGLQFRFLGLPAGSHPTQPRVSADATQLRAPLEPAYVTEILSMTAQSGRA